MILKKMVNDLGKFTEVVKIVLNSNEEFCVKLYGRVYIIEDNLISPYICHNSWCNAIIGHDIFGAYEVEQLTTTGFKSKESLEDWLDVDRSFHEHAYIYGSDTRYTKAECSIINDLYLKKLKRDSKINNLLNS